jgi:Lysyl oxidase
MGVDLVPKVPKESFFIVKGEFVTFEHRDPDNPQQIQDWSAELGCISEGRHRVFRFDIFTQNHGTTPFVLGNPRDHPDIFVHPPHAAGPIKWIMKDKFMVFTLKNDSGVEFRGYKQPWCVKAGKDEHGRTFTCEYQGIGIGAADPYPSFNPCQFIVIDDLEDGEYTFEATVNATSVLAAKEGGGKILFEEDNYNNNTSIFRLRFKGNKTPVVISSNQVKLLSS